MIGLILAAGAGRRMGQPKALLEWDGDTLLQAALRAASASGCREVFAVVRNDVADSLAAIHRGHLIVSSEDDALGPAGSIAAFVRSGRMAPGEVIAIAPVDLVPTAWAVLPQLANALGAAPLAQAARPVHQGRRGHPVLVTEATLAEYATGVPRPLREVLGGLGAGLLDVNVEALAVTADLDTPADLARWRALVGDPPR